MGLLVKDYFIGIAIEVIMDLQLFLHVIPSIISQFIVVMLSVYHPNEGSIAPQSVQSPPQSLQSPLQSLQSPPADCHTNNILYSVS